MPQGDKSAYTDKQKRKAAHIADGYEERGVPEKEAEARAWAAVNKDSGGGNLSGSGPGKPDTDASSHEGGKQAAGRSAAEKSAAAKKGWETRRKNGSG
ncbi:plasmid stabilization protein [Sphingomonas faeni]|uniref:plasmid stabilization protein n=1 Tax=Sphingomonas faeni TaxID=185950 RepID=UPI0033628C14